MGNLIDPLDKGVGAITPSVEELEGTVQEYYGAVILLAGAIPVLKAISRGEPYPAKQANGLLEEILQFTG